MFYVSGIIYSNTNQEREVHIQLVQLTAELADDSHYKYNIAQKAIGTLPMTYDCSIRVIHCVVKK